MCAGDEISDPDLPLDRHADDRVHGDDEDGDDDDGGVSKGSALHLSPPSASCTASSLAFAIGKERESDAET